MSVLVTGTGTTSHSIKEERSTNWKGNIVAELWKIEKQSTNEENTPVK
jgi:hypothetical protein